MPWYKTGTVKTTINSNAIIGTGTAFISNSRVGDAFRGPDGNWYEVVNIASDTAMSISPNYQGPTVAAGTYSIAPMQGYVKESADALRGITNTYGTKLLALGTTGNYDVLPVVKGGTGGTTQAAARTGLGLGSSATLDYTGAGDATRIAKDLATMSKVTDGHWRGLGGFLDLRGTYLERGTPDDVTGIGFVTGFAEREALGIPIGAMPLSPFVQLTVMTPWIVDQFNSTGHTTLRVARAMGIEVVQYATSGTTWSAWSEPNVRGGANSTITSLSGLTTALSVAQGGTGGTTQAAARTGLGLGTAATTDVVTSLEDITTGHTLRVGYAGLGQALTPSWTNLNDCLTNGVFRAHQGLTNRPPFTTGDGDSYQHFNWNGSTSDGAAVQTYYSYSSIKSFIRSKRSGVWTAWEGQLRTVDIVGTVSQSGGIPTGSIIEKGSTATGEYTKFADGTMICRLAGQAVIDITTAYGSSKYGSRQWIYPASFVATPSLSSVARNNEQLLVGTILDTPEAAITSSCTFCYVDAGGPGANTNTRFTNLAIGRWF